MSQRQTGFTLVELSIVLVVIGLLVGGIMAGQSLVRASELRASINEQSKFITAMDAFRDQYAALPGDMMNATSMWGVAGGTGSDDTCKLVVSTASQATCNGDGDSYIRGTGTGYANYNEYYRFWQHLANAGLIEGSYMGTDGRNTGGSAAQLPGVNLPISKLGPTMLWAIAGMGASAGDTLTFAQPAANYLQLTALNVSFVTGPYTPEEAWTVDVKIDDGIPGGGRMRVNKVASTVSGIAPPGDANGVYNISDKTRCAYPRFIY